MGAPRILFTFDHFHERRRMVTMATYEIRLVTMKSGATCFVN